MKLSKWFNKKGFTLIELLISIALIAVVSIPVTAAVIMGLKVYQNEIAVDRVFQDQQMVFMTIKNAIRANVDTTAITTNSNGAQVLEIGKDTKKTSYYLSDQKLYAIQNATTSEILTGVNFFEMTNVTRDADNHLLSFTLSMKVTTGERTQTLTSDFALSRY